MTAREVNVAFPSPSLPRDKGSRAADLPFEFTVVTVALRAKKITIAIFFCVCARTGIIQSPMDQTVFVGENATFHCTASEDATTIDWLKKRPTDTSFKSNPTSKRWEEHGTKLLYWGATLKDDGVTIACDVTGADGSIERRNATLKVVGKRDGSSCHLLIRWVLQTNPGHPVIYWLYLLTARR